MWVDIRAGMSGGLQVSTLPIEQRARLTYITLSVLQSSWIFKFDSRVSYLQLILIVWIKIEAKFFKINSNLILIFGMLIIIILLLFF